MMSFWKREHGSGANAIGLLLTLSGLALFGYTLLVTAWISDDWYITARTADNLVNGHGLRWNVVERVQSFTHPLWLFLNAAVYAVTREGFLTWIAVSMTVSFLAVLTLTLGVARNWGGAALALVVLVFSRGFMDYCTSGLENPLSYLLMALFFVLYFRLQWNVRTLFALSLLAGLATLNRMDLVLIFLPPVLYAWASMISFRATLAVVLGFLPFVVWELFSIVYYGFPFPNTAYAKLGTGIPSGELFEQGLHYFGHTYARDPSTLVFIVIGILLGFFFRERRYAMLSIGATLYLFYVAKIGGDFMGGRFFGVPLFVAVALLSRVELPALSPRTWVIAIIAVVFSLSRPFAPPTTGPDLGGKVYAHTEEGGEEVIGFKDEHGIGDERRFWYQNSGLLAGAPPAPEGLPGPLANVARAALAFRHGTTKPMPDHKYADEGRKYRETQAVGPEVHGSVGFRGFLGGPSIYIIDYYALADPLLARIPARFDPKWRIGHFARYRPEGYEQAALGEPGKIANPQLAEYYAHLRTITRDPLFSADRWRAILAMNFGKYDSLVPWDELRFPGLRKLDYSAVSSGKKSGSAWNAEGNIILSTSGAEVALGGMMNNSLVEFSFDNKDTYLILYMRGGEVVGQRIQTSPPQPKGGLSVVSVPTPLEAVRNGFDAVRVFPYPDARRKEDRFSMGHVKLL
jgi:arabinofuranosyltransferase